MPKLSKPTLQDNRDIFAVKHFNSPTDFEVDSQFNRNHFFVSSSTKCMCSCSPSEQANIKERQEIEKNASTLETLELSKLSI